MLEQIQIPKDGRLKEFSFALGNSSVGPIGATIVVQASTLEEAVSIARDTLDCEVLPIPRPAGIPGVEYANVYFNADALTAAHISGWEYAATIPSA